MGWFVVLCRKSRISYQLCRYYSKTVEPAKRKLRSKKWEPVIGLEIHAQIAAESKLFSGAANRFAAPVNSLVAYLDGALPGTLPVLNKRCVEAGVLTALALECHINLVSTFDRKHYFYADLPAGYQITQQRCPLAVGGRVPYVYQPLTKGAQPEQHVAHITQIQLEQDSGKSLHDVEAGVSLIDLNRAGVALMEIVTEPDFHDGEEVAAFVRELQLILQRIGTCDGKMEEGSLRVDASVSLHHPGEPLGVRSEVKNLNSIRYVAKAVEFEIARQMELLEAGQVVLNETRSFDSESGETVAMRDKERLHDYRFMPEPNLPPLRLYYNEDSVPPGVDSSQVVLLEQLYKSLPELPNRQRERLMNKYGLNLRQSSVLINESSLLEVFEGLVASGQLQVDTTVNFLLNEVLASLNSLDLTWPESSLTVGAVADILDMIQDGTVSLHMAKKVLQEIVGGCSVSPRALVQDRNWAQITDRVVLEELCEQVLRENEQAVKEVRDGHGKVFNFFVGQVLKVTEGRADPKLVSKILKEKLS